MSKQGITITAEFFSRLQSTRQTLIRMGSEMARTKSGQQDILLGQMLRDAEDAVKEKFIRLIDE